MPDQPDNSLALALAHAAPAPTGQRYTCPINTCSWTYDAPPAPVDDPNSLAHIFDIGVIAAQELHHYRTKIEAVLDDHFKQHTIAEYIVQINELQGLSLGLIKQVQELGEALSDALRRSPDLRRDVDPAAQLSAAVGPGTFGLITGL